MKKLLKFHNFAAIAMFLLFVFGVKDLKCYNFKEERNF